MKQDKVDKGRSILIQIYLKRPILIFTEFAKNPEKQTKECVEDPVANGLSLTNPILYIKQL